MKRRSLVQSGALVLLLGAAQIARGATILAVRVWPAPDYTRVTIESDAPLSIKTVFVANPPRLAVDVEGIDLIPALRELVAKIKPDDPFIAGIRVGQNAPNVVRLVVDLKQPALPQVFNLSPVAAYGHRLVLDLYPEQASDPMLALIAEKLAATHSAVTAATRTASSAAAAKPSGVGAPVAALDPLAELIRQQGLNKPGPTASAPSSKPFGAASATVAAASRATPGTTTATAEGSRPSASRVTAGKPAASPAQDPSREPGKDSTKAQAGELAGGATDRFVVVALDPGHGGEDPGAIGPAGTREKDVVLAIALKLRERINATTVQVRQPQGMATVAMRAFLTRDADFFVPLHTRVAKAQRVKADLFLSIHADAFTVPTARGASVFALSDKGATSATARIMAAKENSADKVGGINVQVADKQVQRALLDMVTTAQINDSLKLGASFIGELSQFARMHKPRVEQAGFAVLKAPDIPSVLVETAFISNPEEEQLLRSADYQDRLVDALMRGISRYFARNPPSERARVLS